MNEYVVCDSRATPDKMGYGTMLDFIDARSTTQAVQKIGQAFAGQGCSLWRREGDDYVFLMHLP